MPSTRLTVLNSSDFFLHGVDGDFDSLTERVRMASSKYVASLKSSHPIDLSNLSSMFLKLAEALERLEDYRRLILTSISVKRFQFKHHRWPNDLGELSDFGLTPKDWSTTKKERFGYRVDQDRVFVWSHERLGQTKISQELAAWDALGLDKGAGDYVCVR